MGELESSLEAFFRNRVRHLGGFTMKLIPVQAGIPDRLVIFPGGRFFLVELKQEGEKPSAIQRVWHDRIWERWQIRVEVLAGRAEVIDWIRTVVSYWDPVPPKPGPKRKKTVH